jgi:hypothetical protein
MLVCNKKLSLVCGDVKIKTVGKMRYLFFDILSSVSPEATEELFSDNTWYFSDEETSVRLPFTDDAKLTCVLIRYNEDSTCKVIIKLKKELKK